MRITRIITRMMRIKKWESHSRYLPRRQAGSLVDTHNIRVASGFTLVEAVVATAIFAIAFTAIVGVFLAILRVNERSKQVRLVEQNARYITEFITRELRNGTIDYSAYGGVVPVFTNTLNFIDKEGESASFQLSGSEIFYFGGGAASSQLNSDGTNVTNLRFYIQPSTDPFDATPGTVQPRVSIVIGIESESLRDASHMNLQTTISSRIYPE